jgi:hypothetical protein
LQSALRCFVRHSFRQSTFPSLQLAFVFKVMLVLNIDKSTVPARERLVNGSRGVVIGFETLRNSVMELSSVASDQGRDDLQDDDDTVERGSSSKASLSDLLNAYAKRDSSGRGAMFPIVKFLNGSQRVITPHAFLHESYGGASCSRVQVPLKLAWCLTIHKIQGASLDYVSVDLEGCFESGQAYVALSRARNDNGLSVKNFRRQAVHTDEVAKRFHEAASQSTSNAGHGPTALALMLSDLRPWWHSLLERQHQDYMQLFLRSQHFERLVAAYNRRTVQKAAAAATLATVER